MLVREHVEVAEIIADGDVVESLRVDLSAGWVGPKMHFFLSLSMFLLSIYIRATCTRIKNHGSKC